MRTSQQQNRWVVYSTFDPEGRFAQYAVEQVAAYRAACSSVLVVDTSPAVSGERAGAWDTHATAWFQRENQGYDFGSYEAGLRWIRTRARDGSYSLLLTNDSCYGPFLPLKPFLQRFDQFEGPLTVFGITDSYGLRYHLQSYFLYFQPRTIPYLIDFFSNMGEIHNRSDAINNGEIALSGYLLERGVQLKALSPLCELANHLSFRWVRLGELLIRKLFKKPKYSWDMDLKYIQFLIGPTAETATWNQTLIAGAELYHLGLSPFVKRQFFRDGFYFRYGFAGRRATATVLTNDQVRWMLARNRWF